MSINYIMGDNGKYKLIPGEKMFNDSWNPVFMNKESQSVWLLIVDGLPVMRSEFCYELNDEEVKLLHRDGYGFYKESVK